MPSYDKPKAGEWVRPVRKGYKMACCDCGLVHTINFKLIPWGKGKKILFQVFRNSRSTASMRGWMNRKK